MIVITGASPQAVSYTHLLRLGKVPLEPCRETSAAAAAQAGRFENFDHIEMCIRDRICSLIQCNPEIDFTYTYRRGESSFTADTREFCAVLGDVPLSNPEVVAFIGSFIRENTQEITAQAQ